MTLKVLEQIRDEIRGTNQRVDHLGVCLEETNRRLDATNDKVDLLARRQTEAEVRLATEIVALAGVVREVKDVLAKRLDDRDRVDDHEQRIQALERRRKH
ncbi:MAG: hypothetical protein J0L92_36625 [Deltaproteobacteria bacterium]|nr:hypothetical protein [Deltaproteobacteria bacterium]